MVIVRIGNNIHFLWKIYNNNGSKYALSGNVRRLWLSSASLEKEIETYQIQYRNELAFTIDADDLTRYGTYKLVLQLKESDSQTEDATYDLTQLFQIVARTYPGACKESNGEVDVQVTSVLNNVVVERIEGLSAYEIAVNEGYVGSESEWLESLNGVGIASIDQTVIAVDDGSYNEVTFTLTNGETYTIQIRNGSKGAVTRDDIIFALGYTPVTPADLAAKTDIFFATYNSTTWQEINEAVNSGKAVFLKKDEDIYPLVGDGGVTPKLWEFAFVDIGLDYHRAVCHNDDTWQSATRGLATVIDLADKQDVISDLDAIRVGATLGAIAYQKPSTGIPASDMASGVIPDVSSFITKSVNDLANYYLKSDTYTKAEVQALIGAIQGFSYEVVSELPTASASTMGKIYLAPSADPQTQNVKDEYITIESSNSYSWEQIGSTAVNLSGYVTISQLNTALADYTTTANLTTLLAGKQATISTVNVTVDNNTGTPSGTASVSGSTLSLSFTNLKGAKGDTGATGATGPQGPKGDQGNTGSSVDYAYELINNLTTNDATKGLSAAQGKILQDEIDEIPNELKYFTDSEADLDIADKDFNVLVRFAKGHIETARFSSAEIMKRTLFPSGFVAHGTNTVDGFPSNTIEMFRAAAAAYHTKFIECDFVATSDGKMVGCHNASATMYLNGTAETVTFAEKTLSQLKEYTWDAAGNIKITEITELIDWIKVKGFCLWIDAKGTVTDAMVKAAYAYAKTIGWEKYIFIDDRWWTDEFCNPVVNVMSAAAVTSAAAKKTSNNNVIVSFPVHTGITDATVQEICAAAKTIGVFVAGWTANSTHLEACRRYFTYGTDFIIANGLSNEQI